LVGNIKEVFRNEELRSFLIIVIVSITFITLNVFFKFKNTIQAISFEEAFRHSYFQVASIISTTGYSTIDFLKWPSTSIMILIFLTVTGACAGSTAGGMTLSRVVIAFKGIYINIRKLINPHYVPKARFEGKILEERTVNDVFAFITLYFFIVLIVLVLLSFDPINGNVIKVVSDAGEYEVEHGFFSNFSATLACISNIGPGFEAIGPYSSYANYSYLSKIILSFTMILGRLEILPVLILFNRRTWKKI
jgi:trk system potassium uptake protein TrkH